MPLLKGRLRQAATPSSSVSPSSGSFESDPPDSIISEINSCITFDQDLCRINYLRPSQIGGCVREAFYIYTNVQKESKRKSPQMQMILDNGTAVHEMVVGKWLSMSRRYYVAREVHIWNAELEIFGHMDVALIERDSGRVIPVEVKTINKAGFASLAKPKTEHMFQVNLYASLLGLPWYVLLYYNKDNQTLREFMCKTKESAFDAALEFVREVKFYVESKNTPPYRKPSCNEMFCSYVTRCRKER